MKVEKCNKIFDKNNKLMLKDKVVLMNGASSGIGRVIAQTLLENGVYISATYNKNKKIIDKLIKEYGKKRIINFQIDFLSSNYEDRIEKIVNETLNWRGEIDILINISGIWLVKPFLYETKEEIEWIWRINYWASHTFIKKTVPSMIGKGGQIINIASTAGMKGTGQQVTYCASKAALISLTESLAEELASRQIKVNAISPGPANTSAINKYLDKKSKDLLIKRIPIDRLCQPRDVANAVLCILINDYMTGTNILLHGGRL